MRLLTDNPARLAWAALLLLTAVGPAAAVQPVFHGIVSQGYLNSTDYNYLIPTETGTFAFNETLLNVSAPVSDKLRVGVQLMARNFGSDGNEDLVIDWAFGDYRWKDQLGVRVGKVKTPHGLYNQTRDVDMVRNSILLPQSVYTEVMRDVMNGFEGVSLYGTLNLGDSASLEYDAFVGTVDLERTQFPVPSLVQPMMGAIFGSSLPVTDYRAECERVFGGAVRLNTPLEGLRLGLSAFDARMAGSGTLSGPVGAFTPTLTIDASPWYVVSAEYTRDRLTCAFEFNRAFIDMELSGILVPTGLPDPYPPLTTIAVPVQDRRGGWYGQATWQHNDWFQLGGYYSLYYPDFGVREADGFAHRQRDIALTARFDLTDYWLVKIEGHAMQGTGDVDGYLNPGVAMDVETWSMVGVKSTFYF